MKKVLLFLAAAISSNNYFSQEWVEKAQKPDANLYEIQKDFYEYFKDKDITVKSTGYKAFKRWEYFVEPRVYPSGNIGVLGQTYKNYKDFLDKYNADNSSGNKFNSSNNSVMSATWTSVGPYGAPTGSVGGFPRKAGRDNFVTFHPTNPAIIYAGAAGGGLWVTTDGGSTWTTNTDNLPATTAISDLAIDPTNTNIMYMATGGGDDILSAFPVSSDGLYKTTNGGTTWAVTGLTFTPSQNRVIHKVVLDPTNPQIILVATNAGIYRSTNGGTSFTSVSGINCWDLKFNPGNPSIVYAASGSFYRSTNGGTSFSIVSAGIPTSGINRMSIAVTPTNPSYVYVLASKNSDSQFYGFYRSTNDGVNFTVMSTTPNIIGNSCAGTSTGAGQGWYDLAIAASPITPGEVVIGGVNIWRSSNDGATWACTGCWIGTGSPPYVHADIHELEYTPSGTLYSTNDGGIYSYTGSSWTDLTSTRNIAQIYKIGLSSLTANKWITGHQDNGTNVKNGATYFASLSGDGMDCFIDRTNDNYMYAEQYNGSFNRSTNGGVTWLSIVTGMTGTGAWVTPWKQDPVTAGTIYGGRNQMFKSTNFGTNWSQIGNTGGGAQSVTEFAVASSNNQVIYVVYPGSIRKTVDGGVTWTNVTGTVPAGNLTNVAIDPTDPNTAWVTISGYTAGSKIFETVDGGATWMNISSNLPNIPANCVLYEPGSNDRVYVGMDVGVYYKDNSTTNWTLYNAGLPNAAVMDMEMTPAVPGQIFAATYGRGVYQADAIPTTAAPVPNFSFYGSLCAGVSKTFNDNSSNTPTSWSWSITPTTGVTFNTLSTQNPTVTFANPGTYTVSMQSGNSFGNGPVNTQTITVSTIPAIVLTPSNAVIECENDPIVVNASGATTYTWSNGGGNAATVSYSYGISFTYSVTGANGGCISTATLAVTDVLKPILSLSVANDTVCDQSPFIITAGGANTYTWSNSGGNSATATYTPAGNMTYYVTGTDATTGCKQTDSIAIVNIVCTGLIELGNGNASFNVYPNPVSDKITLKLNSATQPLDVNIELYDVTSKLIVKQNANFNKDKTEYKLNMSSLAEGVYYLKLNSKEGSSKSVKVIKK